jgi:hypothetical protein
LQTTDRAVGDALGYLACAPDIAGPAPRNVFIGVEQYRGRLRIVKEHAVVKEVLNSRAAVEFLHILLFEYSIGDRPQAPLLHAACLRRNGRRLLLAGAGGAGKSTLAVLLIDAGYAFEGDEHVFVEAEQVVVRPRACRIKESSLRLLPNAMAEVAAKSPCYHRYDGERIFNVDPRLFGSSWWIEQGSVDCIFVLRCNHGGFSSIRPMRSSAAVEFLLTETAWPTGSRAGAVAAVTALAAKAKAYEVSLGDHASAIRCINSVVLD